MKDIAVRVIGKDLFYKRMGIEQEFGNVLYDQLISVLELIGQEDNEISTFRMPSIDIGMYSEMHNPGARTFILDEAKGEVVFNHFGHAFYKKLKEYSLREQKKGTEILFQLNEGTISVKDFEERF